MGGTVAEALRQFYRAIGRGVLWGEEEVSLTLEPDP